MTQLDSAIEMLRKEFGGSIVAPADAGYDEHRAVWNAMIDKRPALHRAVHDGPADVAAAVQFGREHGIPIAVRGRWPQRGGQGHVRRRDRDRPVADERGRGRRRPQDGARRVAARRGATSTHETQAVGLATPGGVISTTGIAGLTLGGGFGWLSPPVRALVRQPAVGRPRHRRRAHAHVQRGLERRAVLGVCAVAAATSASRRASSTGSTTSGRSCSAGSSAGRSTRPPTCWRSTGSRRAALPDEIGMSAAFVTAPPLPFVPEELQFKSCVVVHHVLVGRRRRGPRGREALARPRAADPDGRRDAVHDHELDPGRPRAQGPAQLLEVGLPHRAARRRDRGRGRGRGRCPVAVQPRRARALGRCDRAGPRRRDARSGSATAGSCSTRSRCGRTRARPTRTSRGRASFYDALQPFATEGVYVNFLSEEGPERVKEAYGAEKFARLAGAQGRVRPDEPVPATTRTSRRPPSAGGRGAQATSVGVSARVR